MRLINVTGYSAFSAVHFAPTLQIDHLPGVENETP